jgi:hypothetical protein
MEECYAVLAMENHEGGGASVNSKRGRIGNAAYPELGVFDGVVDEVREVVAELWALFGGLRCGDTHVQAQQSNNSDGVSVFCLEGERGGRNGGSSSAPW